MTRTTKAQRVALKRVFDRAPIFVSIMDAQRGCALTYRQFRAMVQPTFGMDGAVVVPWAGMWLAIEADGYVHS